MDLPASNLNFFVEFVERAAGFTELLRGGLETQLVRPSHGMELRAYHLVPAVEYLQANRMRQRLMEETHQALSEVDVVLSGEANLPHIEARARISQSQCHVG